MAPTTNAWLRQTQIGDTLPRSPRAHQFELETASVTPPTDIFGTIRGGRLELTDRADKFWLLVTVRGAHLEGRLSGGSHNRANAISISFERVK